MRSFRITISLAALGTALLTFLYTAFNYYIKLNNVSNFSTAHPGHTLGPNQFLTPMKHIPLDEIYKDDSKYNRDYSVEFEDIKQVQMLDTPGCRIPLSVLSYITKKKYVPKSCGERIVYLRRLDEDKMKILIKDRPMRKLLKTSNSYHCCYRHFQMTFNTSDANIKLRYSACKPFQDSDTFHLESDFVNVQCFQITNTNKSIVIYNDVYGFAKKKKLDQTNYKKCKHKYNVLIVGMDSMSMSRFTQTMRRTTLYLKDNAWLAYRGYNKIGDNTLPNVIASFMGLDLGTFLTKCPHRMDQCNDLFIWSLFKNAGYVTAFGEDYLRLPDTFSKEYAFHQQPTDHYMKPFFFNGEREMFNKSLLCAGRVSSGQQLLDYALDFALTYRKNSFFGFFWVNSFSHNINNRPEDADKLFENFFNQLFYTGIYDNTFVIFLSDHGLRFGEQRLKIASYYDNRLPFLFVWTPPLFRSRYPKKFTSLAANRFRLTTPFDLYKTLLEIRDISSCGTPLSVQENLTSQSLFSVVSGNRTCGNVGVYEKWCSCRKLFPLDIEDPAGVKSVEYAVTHIHHVVRNINTKRCMRCATLFLKNITRIHYYLSEDKINFFYVVAFEMGPENVYYEATVLRKHTNFELIGPISILSPYRGFGQCAVNSKERLFCVCQKLDQCKVT